MPLDPYELDPAEAAQSGEKPLVYSKFAASIPPDVIKFGYIPDLEAMKPGDIVLVQPKHPPAPPTQPLQFAKAAARGDAAWHIQDVQKKFQQGANAKWVHAALYVGRDLVVEAVTPRVGVNPFSRYAPMHRIKVRRLPKLSARDAFDICVEALRRIGDKYDYEAIFGLALAYLGNDPPEPELIKSTFICSELIQKAFYYGGAKVVVNVGGQRMPTPADLAASSKLQDVAVKWRAVS